jgi:hypothetical protein
MAIILLKGEYRIHSKANLNNVLTVNGDLKDATPVQCQKANGTPKQVWRLESNRLYTEMNPKNRDTFCLDRLNTSKSPADIYTNNDDANQLVKLIGIPNEDYAYRISLKNKALFLTTDDYGNCSWTEKLDTSNEKQIWVFEKVVRVEDMPNITAFQANGCVEYFSGCTGWKNGSFKYAGNIEEEKNGQDRNVVALVQKLYDRVSKNGPLDVSENAGAFLHNFPGALAYGQGIGLDGYYHMGIDINYGTGAAVYPLKEGTVFGIIHDSYSAIGIKSSFFLPDEDTPQDFVVWYLHMIINENLDVDDPVTFNTSLGTISNQGYKIQPHLHIEVQKPDRDKPMVPSEAGLYLKGDYFGAYDLLDFIEAA